jgi:hypothetical protein
MVVRSDIVLWRFFSVMSGDVRGLGDNGDIHLLKTNAETNNIGKKYLKAYEYQNQIIPKESVGKLTSAQDKRANKRPTKRPKPTSSQSNVISS